MTDVVADAEITLDEHDLLAQRRAKLAQLRSQGNAFPNDFRRQHLAAELLAQYADFEADALEATPIAVSVAGRMMTRRIMGKAAFAMICPKASTTTISNIGTMAIFWVPPDSCLKPKPVNSRLKSIAFVC